MSSRVGEYEVAMSDDMVLSAVDPQAIKMESEHQHQFDLRTESSRISTVGRAV